MDHRRMLRVGENVFFNATGHVTANTSISDIKTVQFWVRLKTNFGTIIDFNGGNQLPHG